MPTLVNNLRAIRGPVTAVPMVGQSGVVVEPDNVNNQVVVRADETVLWEGTGDILTSESITNFERIRIITAKGGTCEVVPNGTNIDFALMYWSEEDASALQFYSGRLSSSDGKTFTYSRVIRYWTAGSSGTGGTNIIQKFIVKIVGINRIANN